MDEYETNELWKGNLKAVICRYDDLTEDEKLIVPENGCGAVCANYIRVTHNGKTIRLESDAMEKEDAIFLRDLDWIPDAVVEAYKLGFQDGFRRMCLNSSI